MRCLITGSFLVLAVAAAGQVDAGVIYSSHARHMQLGTIDTATGEGANVGSYGMPDAKLVSGAFDTHGQFYSIVLANLPWATATTQLATVDRSTGAATLVGSPTDAIILPLEVDSSNTMYSMRFVNAEFGLGGDPTLFTVDKSSGQLTTIGNTGVERAMDLAFDSHDELWVVGGADGGNRLYTIDVATGESTFQTDITGVAEATGVDGAEIMGIMFDEHDTLFATAFFGGDPDFVSPLFTIDTSTGAATVVGSTGLVLPHGGDYLVPEPGTLIMVLSGVLLLVVVGRRKKVAARRCQERMART